MGLDIKILSVQKTVDCLIGDDTAVSKAILPTTSVKFKKNSIIRLENMDAKVINEKITIVPK